MGEVWKIEKRDNVAILTIDKPPLNLVVVDEIYELGEKINELRMDDNVRCVVVTGTGKAFIGGADVSQFPKMDPTSAAFSLKSGHRVLREIEEMEKAVIAAVNGFALGGGCEVALACDIRVCSESAKFGQLEINYGIIPGWGATQRLARIVGYGRARELILTGRMIDAREAYQIGLVSQVIPDDRLLDEALSLAGMLAEKPPIAVALAKEMLNASTECSLPVGGGYEALSCAITMGTEDCSEGVRAFIEKRKPDFKGK